MCIAGYWGQECIRDSREPGTLQATDSMTKFRSTSKENWCWLLGGDTYQLGQEMERGFQRTWKRNSSGCYTSWLHRWRNRLELYVTCPNCVSSEWQNWDSNPGLQCGIGHSRKWALGRWGQEARDSRKQRSCGNLHIKGEAQREWKWQRMGLFQEEKWHDLVRHWKQEI